MTRSTIATLVLLFILPLTATAQTDCTFDFSKVIPMLQAAQTLDEVVQARVQIQLQEAECTDFNQDHGGDSRTNPVPFGMTADVKADKFDAKIQITGYVDDGEAILLKANNRNDPAPAGKRYILVAFQFACNRWPDESCDYSRVQFSVVGDKGIAYRYDSADLRNGSVSEAQELFGGASITVGVAFLVDDDDSNFVLFTEYGDPRTYFATE